MDKLLAFLKTYAYDSASKKPLRSTLPATILVTLIIVLLIEVPAIMSMNELGIAANWIHYKLETVHLIVSLVSYFVLFALIRALFLVFQWLPDLYKKAKEEDERNKLDDEKY